MVGFNTIELFHQWIDFNEEEGTYQGVKTASQETLEELIAADTAKKLREFTAQWFPFMSYWKSWERPDFEEEVKAASGTRDLILLVLELKRTADEDDCSREAFERLGVTFSKGGTEKHEQATMHYLASSDSFSKYIRAVNHCKTCGLPIIVSGERGTKRLYCNDTCKRKFKRALKFASLVNDEGMELQDAAKASGMAAATATRILERNGIRVDSAQ